jgi:hypothetical protein
VRLHRAACPLRFFSTMGWPAPPFDSQDFCFLALAEERIDVSQRVGDRSRQEHLQRRGAGRESRAYPQSLASCDRYPSGRRRPPGAGEKGDGSARAARRARTERSEEDAQILANDHHFKPHCRSCG